MLAIIIPYYRKSFFNDTLKSLSNQTDKRFRVYIGDDASPKDVIPIIEKYKTQFNINYHRFEKNLGSTSLVEHWKRCIKMTKNEEWLQILGDDDLVSENFVEVFYKNIKKVNDHNINVIKFSTKVIDKNSKLIYNNTCEKAIVSSTDSFYEKINNLSRSSLSEHVFRRSSFDKYGFKNYDLAWHADDMAWLELSNFKDIYCIDDSSVSIRVSDSSISGKSSNKDKKDKAAYQFYADLTDNYFNNFKRSQKDLIIRIFETKTIAVKGKSLNSFNKIALLFIKNTLLVSFIRFTYRFLFKY